MSVLARPDGCRLNFELHGSEGDPMILLEGLGGDIPGAELVWRAGASHLYHFEQAGESDAAVLAFVRRHPV